jgi:hypothetical protein
MQRSEQVCEQQHRDNMQRMRLALQRHLTHQLGQACMQCSKQAFEQLVLTAQSQCPAAHGWPASTCNDAPHRTAATNMRQAMQLQPSFNSPGRRGLKVHDASMRRTSPVPACTWESAAVKLQQAGRQERRKAGNRWVHAHHHCMQCTTTAWQGAIWAQEAVSGAVNSNTVATAPNLPAYPGCSCAAPSSNMRMQDNTQLTHTQECVHLFMS